MAQDCREGGATALPAPKKSLEGTVVALVDRVFLLNLVLGVAPAANVQQRDMSSAFVFMRTFFLASA